MRRQVAVNFQVTSNSLRFDESEYGAIIGALVYNETKCNFLRHSTFDPTCTTLSLVDLINAPSELGNLHTYQVAIYRIAFTEALVRSRVIFEENCFKAIVLALNASNMFSSKAMTKSCFISQRELFG